MYDVSRVSLTFVASLLTFLGLPALTLGQGLRVTWR
jgi:hypothetical protein